MSSWPWLYTKVATLDPDNSPTETAHEPDKRPVEAATKHAWSRTTTRRIIQITLAVFLTAALVAISVYGLLYGSNHRDHEHPHHHQHSNCGNTSREALARGCSFDQLTWSWYPPRCPHYANDDFLTAEPQNPWVYYTDPYNKIPVTKEEWYEAIDNKKQIYGERREHLTHCVYMLLSVGQIIRDGTAYAPILVSYEHLDHCSRVLLDALRLDKKWYEVETQVPKISYDQQC